MFEAGTICSKLGFEHLPENFEHLAKRSEHLPEVIPKHLSREGDAPSRSLPRVAIPREEPYQRFDARDLSIFRGEATEYSEL